MKSTAGNQYICLDMAESVKLAAATPRVWLGDVRKNADEIMRLSREAALQDAAVVAFPKDALTGATIGDLAAQRIIREQTASARAEIAELSDELGIAIVLDPTDAFVEGLEVSVIPDADPELVTADRKRRSRLAAASAGKAVIWCNAGWGESTTDFVFAGGSMIFAAGKCVAADSRFKRESSIIYADIALPLGEMQGDAPAAPFEPSAAHPFVPDDPEELASRCADILEIQTAGLAARMSAINCRSLVLGISGGLDSTLALLVCARAFDSLGLSRKGILAVTMPGFGTPGRTHDNAVALMAGLGVSCREISIAASVRQHLQDIGHDFENHNVTYENAQARERTQILMDLANDCDGLVVGTGDLSEIALGWCTYNGDHISMYGVNAGVPKTLMQAMVRWAAGGLFAEVGDVLRDIVATPISPELLPGVQPTEDLVGPYELHDFFLYHLVRRGETPREIIDAAIEAFSGHYDAEIIDKWLRKFLWRFFSQQFKRSCCSDSPAVGSVSLSPRTSWRMPSDISAAPWVADLDS